MQRVRKATAFRSNLSIQETIVKNNAVNELGTMNRERREDREKPMKANYQLEQNMGDRDAEEHSRTKLI